MNLITNIFLPLILFAVMLVPDTEAGNVMVKNLRCEYRKNPMGVDALRPRLSWILESNQLGQKQTAYHILLATRRQNLDKNIGDIWDSGKVESGQSIQIPYQGAALKSTQTYYWKVRIWDKEGNPSSWSEPAYWTTGLLNKSDWQAKWIGLDRAVGKDDLQAIHTRLSVRMLRYEFTLDKKIKKATAFICGLGLFELYLNGQKIGNQVLSPGLTEYNKRSFYMTFDVTDELQQQSNALGVILGNGRYFAPRAGDPTNTRTYGFPKLLLQINIQFSDGTSTFIITDEKWKIYCDGPIQANNEYDGEIYDARKEVDNWHQVGFDDSYWLPVELVEKPGEQQVSQMNEPIEITETLYPIAISEPQPGVYVFDMGQNMVGWVRLKVQGKAGTKVTLKFAEVLQDNGMLYLDNIRSAEVTDIYITRGAGTEIWEPRFTYHGFRYVEIRGFPGKPDLSAIEGKVVHDAVEYSGTFTCSNPLINQIYKNAVWGIRGNYRSIPTDCPQRDERQGWLGDRSVESKGESYIFDIVKLYNKWLNDIQDAQLDNGSIPDVAPSYWPIYSDNTTWPGSYIIIPAMLYDQYADLETIRKHYPTMKKWIGHMSRFLQEGIMPRDQYGDWCVPPENLALIHTNDTRRTTSAELIGTAYFFYELRLMQRFAHLLNNLEDAAYYERLADQMKKAFNNKFLQKDKVRYSNNSHTANILPLAFDLVPPEYREHIFDNLVEKIMGESEEHIGSGLIGCQWIMRVLSDNGRPDIAYTLAAQNSYPSWGYMVENGATTIWELWNGSTGDPGMNSHNHVMLLGDLIVWYYEYLAGIKSDPEYPGFKHIIMRPQVVGDLNFVEASYLSMYGLIESNWKLEDNQFYWDIRIPANTTATVYVPGTRENIVTANDLIPEESDGVQFLKKDTNGAVYRIESGKYTFISKDVKRMIPVPFVLTPEISPADTIVTTPNQISVTIKNRTPQAKVYFTTDGREPDESSTFYERPIPVSNNMIIKAKAFKKGYHPSIEKSVMYDFVDPQKNGVHWELYQGSWTRLPDFQSMKAVSKGHTFQIDLQIIDLPEQNFALVFSGFIDIREEGEYTFYTNSNDGSRLFIDNMLVVDHDGEHGPSEKSGKIFLTPGNHSIKVSYFQSGGSKVLKVFYQGPGFEQKIIPASVLFIKSP
jgi:alpha-L-rhamnosidase